MAGQSGGIVHGSSAATRSFMKVTVKEITDDGRALVVDDFGVDKDIPAYHFPKGAVPAPGDVWLCSRQFGPWSFAQCLYYNPLPANSLADILPILSDLGFVANHSGSATILSGETNDPVVRDLVAYLANEGLIINDTTFTALPNPLPGTELNYTELTGGTQTFNCDGNGHDIGMSMAVTCPAKFVIEAEVWISTPTPQMQWVDLRIMDGLGNNIATNNQYPSINANWLTLRAKARLPRTGYAIATGSILTARLQVAMASSAGNTFGVLGPTTSGNSLMSWMRAVAC